MAGYGKSFAATYGKGTCADCNKPIRSGQIIRYNYDKGKVLCHENCEKANNEPVLPTYGSTFTPDSEKGLCSECKRLVRAGQKAHYKYLDGSKWLCHVNCKAAAESVEEEKKQRDAEREMKQKETPFRLGGGSGYGCSGWQQGQIVSVDNSDEPYKEYPKFLYVVEAGRNYYREEGMSFGVGDESGYTYWARCREATIDESQPLIGLMERKKKIQEMKVRVAEIEKMICETGECPQGDNSPEGEKIFDTQNIYGSGSWFVVGSEWIWYVRNNGMDGDNWSRNNVRTGGAGAVGWRIPYNQELAKELMELASIVPIER